MQIEMMFCTIITYLIWFCCCFLSLLCVCGERRGWKSFWEIYFIIFSMVNVWGEHQVVFNFFHWNTRVWEQSEEYEREFRLENSFSTRQWPPSHIRKMCLQISTLPHKIEIHSAHNIYIDQNEGLNSFYTAKYCTIFAYRICAGGEMNMQITREENLQCFHTWNEINIFS